MTYMHKHFKSPVAMADWFEPQIGKDRRVVYYDSYTSGHTRALAGITLLRKGQDTYVEAALALLKQFNEDIEVPALVWEHAIAGAFPDVPAYLSGDPENMWYQAPSYSDRTPLRVWFGLDTSGDVRDEHIRKRGVTLAAFAIAVSNKRPVFITPYVAGGEYSRDKTGKPIGASISWDIATSPLVLSELLTNLAESSITRHIGVPAPYMLNTELHSYGAPFHPESRNPEGMRAALGCAAHDLYIPAMRSTDELVNNPLTWLKHHVAKYTTEVEDLAA